VRLNTNGTPDSTFACTNQMSGYIFALLPLPDGSLLFGGNYLTVSGASGYALFHLLSNGRLDDSFDAGLNLSSVFCLARQTNGRILVGGLLCRVGAATGAPLFRLNPDLHWDDAFQVDAFTPASGPPYSALYSLLIQPDGKLVGGGGFCEVGGYWRRNIVRFNTDGHVDGCFDPGLGIAEGAESGPVRTLALQPDGHILVGGFFYWADTAYGQQHLARLLPRSDCDLVRVYLKAEDPRFAAATFPPGQTNYLELSTNLATWQVVQTNTSPYIFYPDYSTTAPRTFFRARQVR